LKPENRSAETHFHSPAFFVFWKGKVMLVHYKRNKQTACYDSNNLVTVGKIPSAERPRGPFQSCGSCPYPLPQNRYAENCKAKKGRCKM